MESSLSPVAESNTLKRKCEEEEAVGECKKLKVEPEEDAAVRHIQPSGSPSISVPFDQLQQTITVTELTELLHFAAIGKKGGIKQPSWCHLHRQRKIKGLNVVIVEGMTQSNFYKNYLIMKHLRTNYATRVTFTPSCNSVASEIFSREVPLQVCSLDSKQDEKLYRAIKFHPVITTFGTQIQGLTAYVLTEEQMIKNHFPVKGFVGFEEYVCTESSDCITDCSPLYGLDCEMCLTEKGYELTRVSLVDSDGNCLLDELVKPPNRVLNYLTKFSGITAAMLRPIKTTLQDVQAKLRMLLPGDAVLVGHSLNNDLIALKLIHRHVIDTSLLYRGEFGRKFKLKLLAEMVLKRQIQTEEKNGHNSIEDALAALELAQYFIKIGPHQVVELYLKELWGYRIEEEPPESEPAPIPSHRFSDVLQALDRSVVFLGKRADITLSPANQLWYNTDREVLACFREQTKLPFLSVLQFSSFSDHLKRCFPHQDLLHQTVCANLRDMCLVFAGPLPEGFSRKEVKQLFRCCGPIRKIQMLNSNVRIHAAVEFKLLEGAMLAIKTLNGLSVLGQPIKVQRPVHDSLLDLELNLDALMRDTLNGNSLYVVESSQQVANIKLNGHASDAEFSAVAEDDDKTISKSLVAKINGQPLTLSGSSWELSETLTEKFGCFGMVETTVLPAKDEKCIRHAIIKFESSEGKDAALNSSVDVLKDNYLICPSLTPSHVPSWVAMATPGPAAEADVESPEDQRTHQAITNCQDSKLVKMMKKLDWRLQKVFKSLPDGTLSVVLLLGQTSMKTHYPGLCFIDIKQAS